MAMPRSERIRRAVRKGLRQDLTGLVTRQVGTASLGRHVVIACGVQCELSQFGVRLRDEGLGGAILSYFTALGGARSKMWEPERVADAVSVALAVGYQDRKADAWIEVATAPHLTRNHVTRTHVGRIGCSIGPAYVHFPLKSHRVKTMAEWLTDEMIREWLGDIDRKGDEPKHVRARKVDVEHELERFGLALEELDGS